MKKLFMLSLILTFALFGMEKYDRKSISVTKIAVSNSAAKEVTVAEAKKGQSKLMKRLRTLGRFDFNPIPSGVNNPTELFSIVKEYAETKIEERAERQWNIKNDFYGTNFVTGENVDKIINGTYLFFPKLSTFTMKYDKKKKEYICNLEMKIKIYSATNSGTPENPNWQPTLVKEVSASGTNYSLLTGGSKKRKDAVESAYSGMLEFMIKAIKNVDQFKIKALITKADPKNDKMTFGMGRKVGGIKVDDAYLIGYKQRVGGKDKFVETGYMKIRKVRTNDSEAQLLIVSNPKGVKESELYTEYDQVIEYPKVGLNFILSGGINGFQGFNEDYFKNGMEEDDEYSFAPSFGLTAEYGLGRTTGISELYTVANIDYTIVEKWVGVNDNEIEFTSLTYEFGFRKKFYNRSMAFLFGVSGIYHTTDVDLGDLEAPTEDESPYALTEKNHSFGGKAELGIEMLLSKDAFVQLVAGYRVMGSLINEFDNKVGDDSENEFDKKFVDDKFYTPQGLTAKLAIGFNI